MASIVASRPGSSLCGYRSAVLRRGVHRVEQARGAAVVAVRVERPHRGVLAERDVLQVTWQRHEHGPAGIGVDAGDRHGVGADSDSVLAGVGAQQQNVVAALERSGRLRRREHLLDHLPGCVDRLRGDHGGRTDTQHQRGVDEHHQPAAHQVEVEGLRHPPGVDQQGDPADGQEGDAEAGREQNVRVGEQVERSGAVGAEPDDKHRSGDQQAGPHHEPEHPHPASSDRVLGRAGRHDGHAAQGEGTPESNARRVQVVVLVAAAQQGRAVAHASSR